MGWDGGGDAGQGGGAERKQKAWREPGMVKSLRPWMETTGPRLGRGNREPAENCQDL